MARYRFKDKAPQVPASAYVAAEATLIGDVRLGEGASLWPGAVARGDNAPIHIGEGSNVQEGAVLHADPGFALTLGAHVTVGHQAMLHGCSVGEGALIGIQAVVLNGAVIGAHSLVGAGAIVTERKQFPPRSLILGALNVSALYQGLDRQAAPPVGERPTDLQTLERQHIVAVLQSVEGDKTRAAQLLGISRSTLERRCAEWAQQP